jgi:predicted dehydrogenase
MPIVCGHARGDAARISSNNKGTPAVEAFKVAIVGGGGISRAHIAAAKASGGRVVVAAVIDPNEPARKGAADVADARGFATFDDFAASDAARETRGVIVCTPPSVRIPIVHAALGRGMHVLAEKPIAHNVTDATAQAALAAAHPRLVCAVGYCHRFTPAIIEMKRRIAAGEIGDVTRLENTFAAPLPKMADHWMSDETVSGGGSFIDTGCHSLDLFLHLIGDGAVQSAIFHRAWPGRGESSATVLLRSDGGVAGVIQSGWTEPARFVLTIVGTTGSLSYDYDVATEVRFRGNDGRDEKIPVESHELRFQRQLEAFATVADGGRPSVVPATFAEGVITARRVADAQKLAKTA